MSAIYTKPIFGAKYVFKIKEKERTLRCTKVDEKNVYFCDEETEYKFSWNLTRFAYMIRTASVKTPILPTLNECPYFTEHDEEVFRRAEVDAGERNVVTFATEFNSSEEFEKSITWLLSATSQESEEIKRRNGCYDAEELYAELLYFFDFPKSRTEQKKQKLIKAHNVAFNVMLESRGPSWFAN